MRFKVIILKIKSFIYRHTGIYLAASEELEYVTSKPALRKVLRMYNDKENELSLYDAISILRGTWQVENGFAIKINMRQLFKKD